MKPSERCPTLPDECIRRYTFLLDFRLATWGANVSIRNSVDLRTFLLQFRKRSSSRHT